MEHGILMASVHGAPSCAPTARAVGAHATMCGAPGRADRAVQGPSFTRLGSFENHGTPSPPAASSAHQSVGILLVKPSVPGTTGE